MASGRGRGRPSTWTPELDEAIRAAAALGWRWALVERAVGRPAAALAKRASRLGVAKITRRLPGETKAEYARWAQRRYNGRTGNLHGDNPLAEYAVAFGLPEAEYAKRCLRYCRAVQAIPGGRPDDVALKIAGA